MPHPNWTWSAADRNYRYGFNGVEKEGEVYGKGNLSAMDFRMYDPRVGRWWGVDKIVKVHESPYAAFFNNPINYADPSGLNPGVGLGADATVPPEYSGPPTREEATAGFSSGRGSKNNPIVYDEDGNVVNRQKLPFTPSRSAEQQRATGRAISAGKSADAITEFTFEVGAASAGGGPAINGAKYLIRAGVVWGLQNPEKVKSGIESGIGVLAGYDGPETTPIGMVDDAIETGIRNYGDDVVEAELKSLVRTTESVGWQGVTKYIKASVAEVAEAAARIKNYRAANKGRVGNYGYLEGVIDGVAVDNKMWPSVPTELAIEEIHIFDAIEVAGKHGSWERITDSEYRMLNALARQLGGVQGQKYPHITGALKIVSENIYCTSCQGIIDQFHDMFPDIDLILVDGVK